MVASTPPADWRGAVMVQTHGHHPKRAGLAKDGFELRNLLADPAFAEVLVKMRERWIAGDAGRRIRRRA